MAAAGCLGSLERRSTEIVDVEFETSVDVGKDFDDDPAVGFEGDEIHVTGRYSTGNACYDAHLSEPTYDADADELRIRLARQHDGSDECDDLAEMVSYRVVVRLEGPQPGIVHVTEDMGGETRAESGLLSFG
ncbi:hypothetical protein SAMN04489842_1397 [Natronobacterium texcoconense]|uniref:Uncharacterized protein n=2 Tax=Natronobacterium texcoconense TaxID=1095778 RepID=A0A1H1CGN1_NATTX|nr:hypothetical protein SAMN04489842_1397 [Natronobacterium texcoconense]